MDKNTANELVAIIDAKMESLKKDRAQILAMVDSNGILPMKPASEALGKLSEPVRRFYEAVLATGKSLAIKEMVSLAEENGIQLTVTRLRQVLHQHNKKLFESKRRGVWKARPV